MDDFQPLHTMPVSNEGVPSGDHSGGVATMMILTHDVGDDIDDDSKCRSRGVRQCAQGHPFTSCNAHAAVFERVDLKEGKKGRDEVRRA